MHSGIYNIIPEISFNINLSSDRPMNNNFFLHYSDTQKWQFSIKIVPENAFESLVNLFVAYLYYKLINIPNINGS